MFDLFEDVGFPFSPDGSLFCPAGADVYAVHGIGKLAQESLPAMGYGMGLQESWLLLKEAREVESLLDAWSKAGWLPARLSLRVLRPKPYYILTLCLSF